jgi:hypothetical protein
MGAIKIYSAHIWETQPMLTSNIRYGDIDCLVVIDAQNTPNFCLDYDTWEGTAFEREITKPEEGDIFEALKGEWIKKAPLHYMQSFQVDEKSETGKQLIAQHVEMRIRGEA